MIHYAGSMLELSISLAMLDFVGHQDYINARFVVRSLSILSLLPWACGEVP